MRTKVAEISLVGRNTQGARLISLSEDEKLSSVASAIDDSANEDSEL